VIAKKPKLQVKLKLKKRKMSGGHSDALINGRLKVLSPELADILGVKVTTHFWKERARCVYFIHIYLKIGIQIKVWRISGVFSSKLG
jgi:hypothetical protein